MSLASLYASLALSPQALRAGSMAAECPIGFRANRPLRCQASRGHSTPHACRSELRNERVARTKQQLPDLQALGKAILQSNCNRQCLTLYPVIRLLKHRGRTSPARTTIGARVRRGRAATGRTANALVVGRMVTAENCIVSV